MLKASCAIILAVFAVVHCQTIPKDILMPLDEYMKYHQYPLEKHDVTTPDGYILQIFRVQGRGQKIVAGKKPVLLVPGLGSSGESFLANDHKLAPGFRLADEGFDVWIPNPRGIKFSRRHTRLNPDMDQNFWNFTWEDIASQDIPTFLKYVGEQTKQKVDYIGYSQGGLVGIAALTLNKQEVSQNLGKVLLWGAVCFMQNLKAGTIVFASWTNLTHTLMRQRNYMKETAKFAPMTEAKARFCWARPQTCTLSQFFGHAETIAHKNGPRLVYLMARVPAGNSRKNVIHFQQLTTHRQPTLPKFNYGKSMNKEVYGQETAPVFPLEQIKDQRLYIFIAAEDNLATPRDLEKFAAMMGSQVKFKKTYQNMSHGSFTIGKTTEFLEDTVRILREP